MTTSASTRERMIDSSARLLTRRGIAAVTVDSVLADSGAPRGSVYHHFPGGREELALEGARRACAHIDSIIRQTSDASDFVRAVSGLYRARLRDTDFRAGCPVVALTVDAHVAVPGARELASECLSEWRSVLDRQLRSAGVRQVRATSAVVLSLLEGALVLCRAERSLDPLGHARAECLRIIDERSGGDR